MSAIVYTSSIRSVDFFIQSDSDNEATSSANITSSDLFRSGAPHKDGPYDMRLGTVDHGYKCSTCHNKKSDCIGHEGVIHLNYPVMEPLFVKEIVKWLKVICHNCKRPIIAESKYKVFKEEARLSEATKIVRQSTANKVVTCINCNFEQPNIIKDKNNDPLIIFVKTRAMEEPMRIYPHQIKAIFDHIPDSVVNSMGKSVQSHPRNMISSKIKVPSVVIRPDVRKVGGGRSTADDLTMLIQHIVKKNEKVDKIDLNDISATSEKNIYELNKFYFDLVKGHTTASVKQQSFTSIALRFKGKQGRFRKNQMGKRVRMCCRSTISGDPLLKPNEIKFPQRFARNLQIEEVVRDYNIDQLYIYFNNGTARYPGCSKIIKARTGAEHSIKPGMKLEIGDRLFRDIVTGDVCTFNRQPSLMPSNISGMNIIVSDDPTHLTICMNVVSCSWYNADFDGDAMNVWINTSITARNEISEVNAVENYFISHAKSTPLVGCADDAIIGSFELSRDNVKLDRYHSMMLFTNMTFLPDMSDFDGFYTGRDIVSKILSETPISHVGNTNFYQEQYAPYIAYKDIEKKVVIKRGKMISGVLDKKSVSKGGSSIFQVIYSEYGPRKAIETIFNMQQAAHYYMYQFGFTVGIKDMLLPESANEKIHHIGSKVLTDADLITEKLSRSELIPPIGQTVHDFYEQQSAATLRIMDDFIEPIFQNIDTETNNLFKLVGSGSKGNIAHMLRMMCAVGQALLNGERTEQKFGTKRTLPWFRRGETDPKSRGYIPDSYIAGIRADQFVMDSMPARFALISKALSTSVTGEQNRKSIYNLETIVVDNLRFCLKGDKVVQFAYGECNLDPRYVEKVKFPTVMISDADLAEKYRFPTSDTKMAKFWEEEFQQIVADRDEYRHIFMQFEAMNNTVHKISDVMNMPVNVERVMINTLHQFDGEMIDKPVIGAAECRDLVIRVREWISNLPYVLLNDIQERLKTRVPSFMRSTTMLTEMLVRSCLCGARMARWKLPKDASAGDVLDVILRRIKTKYQKCLIQYGSTVGILAAQSFSEPLTQYMLDSHHRGVSGGTSKNEMNRAKEILAARPTSKMAAPVMMIECTPDINHDEIKVQYLANQIEMLKLGQFVWQYSVFFEKFGEPEHPDYVGERELIERFVKMNPLYKPPTDLTKWCIRYQIDKSMLILKNITIEYIVMKLREAYPRFYILYSTENTHNVIIRVYISSSYFRDVVQVEQIIELGKQLQENTLRGVDGIKNTKVVEIIRSKVGPDGDIIRDKGRFGIKTDGTNLAGVMIYEGVDPLRIQSDSIEEMYKVFGKEAARQKIISELRGIGEGGINHGHFTIYADEMTRVGRVTAIERGSLSVREKNNIFLRMGFSAPMASIEEAAINSITDNITGATAKLLIGATPRIGTTYNKAFVNPDIIAKYAKTSEELIDNL